MASIYHNDNTITVWDDNGQKNELTFGSGGLGGGTISYPEMITLEEHNRRMAAERAQHDELRAQFLELRRKYEVAVEMLATISNNPDENAEALIARTEQERRQHLETMEKAIQKLKPEPGKGPWEDPTFAKYYGTTTKHTALDESIFKTITIS